MRPVYRTARDAGIGALTAYGLYELTPRIRALVKPDKKEISMSAVYDAETLDLSHLYPVRIRYAHKDINTEAIQANQYTIGKLALEFETELCDLDGRPYFTFRAKRLHISEPGVSPEVVTIRVRLDDWIVALWGELHVFSDDMLKHTFELEETVSPGVPPYLFDENAKHSVAQDLIS